MPKIIVVEGGTVKLTPGPGWSWSGWDGIIKLKKGQSILKVDGKPVIIESDIPKFPYKPKNYTAVGFSDTPGLIATVIFLPPTDSSTLTKHLKRGVRCLTNKTKGTFSAIVGVPSMKVTPGGPIPDVVLTKTGTWKIDKHNQDILKEDKVTLSELEEDKWLNIEYVFDDNTPVNNSSFKIKF